jgi:Fibronectin type III domain
MILMYRCVFALALGLYLFSLTGCGGGEGERGATASLSWEPVNHPMQVFYTVHYGKESSRASGSCNYENSVDVSEPFAMIAGLEFNTRYYFAVSASTEHGHRSHCSNEVYKLTPEAPQVQIGDPPVTL